MTDIGRSRSKRHGVPRASETGGPSKNSRIFPIIIERWQRSANDTIMIKIDLFRGAEVIDIRAWWTSPDGELRPGRSGITMSVRHLPSLAHALTKAEAAARKLGLLTEPDDA